MFVKLKGLITRETRFKDHDKMLTVITAERGRISVRARGVMRLKCPFAPACQLFSYTDFTLFENKGLYSVNAAEPLELFLGLRTDPRKLALAAYFSDIAAAVADSDSECEDLLRLTLNCLYALAADSHPPEWIRAAFEMRMACIAGYTPQLAICSRCGTPCTQGCLLPTDGAVCCADCLTTADRMAGTLFCPPGVLPALAYFSAAPLKKVLPAPPEEPLISDTVAVTERYLFTQLDCDTRPLHFYKSFPALPVAAPKGHSYDN